MCTRIVLIFMLLSTVSFSQEKDTTLLRLEKAVTTAENDSLRIERLLLLGEYQLRRDFNTVQAYSNQTQQLIDKQQHYDTRLQRAELFEQLGILNRKHSNYSTALDYYLKAQKLYLAIGDSIYLPSNYHNIGTVYRYQKEYKKAILYLKKALRTNRKFNRPKQDGTYYTVLGSTYSIINKKDSVLYFFDKAQEKYKIAGYEEGVHQVIKSRSNMFISQKKYTEALPLQLDNLVYVESIGKKESIASANYNLARIYIGLENYQKAIFHVNAAIKICKEENMGRLLAFSYKIKSKVFYKQKVFENALDYYRKYSKTNDSVFNVQKTQQIREIELNYKFAQEKQADSIQFAEEKKRIFMETENQTLKKKLYLILFLITLVLGILATYYGIRYFKKRWEKAKENQAELHSKLKLSKAQSKQRITLLKSEIGDLSNEILTRKEEVTALMTESLQYLKSKEKLVDDLKKVASQEEDISLKSIIADLNSDVIEDARLSIIKNHLDELNFEFFKTIKAKHPNLTKTDIEICSYLRLSLGRKEIAALRFTSAEAVKKSRNRLRKKMNLSPEDSLEAYIMSLS